MFENYKLKEYEYNCNLNIPKIKNDFINNEDIIDINDYQDAFGLLYELIYINNINFNDTDNITFLIEEFFNSILSNIRSNKLIKINSDNKENNIYNKEDIEIESNDDLDDYINKCVNNHEFLNDLFDNDNLFDNDKLINNYDFNNKIDDIIINSNLLNNNDNSSKKYKIKSENIKNYKHDSYKKKYEKYKMDYLKLKNINKLIEFNYFNINLLLESDNINNEIIDYVLNFYNFHNINYDENSEISEIL